MQAKQDVSQRQARKPGKGRRKLQFKKAELEALRRRMPPAYRKKVALVLKGLGIECTTAYVSMVMNGKQDDVRVVKAAVEVAETHERELMELRNRMVRKVNL